METCPKSFNFQSVNQSISCGDLDKIEKCKLSTSLKKFHSSSLMNFSSFNLNDSQLSDVNESESSNSKCINLSENTENIISEQKFKETEEVSLDSYKNIIFKEIDPTDVESYTCPITLESRSSSLNSNVNFQSPANILISNSSVNIQKENGCVVSNYINLKEENVENLPNLDTKHTKKKINDISESSIQFRLARENEFNLQFNSSKYLATKLSQNFFDSSQLVDVSRMSSINLYEDKNFEYDSLANNYEEKIPVDFSQVISNEDSLNCFNDSKDLNLSVELCTNESESMNENDLLNNSDFLIEEANKLTSSEEINRAHKEPDKHLEDKNFLIIENEIKKFDTSLSSAVKKQAGLFKDNDLHFSIVSSKQKSEPLNLYSVSTQTSYREILSEKLKNFHGNSKKEQKPIEYPQPFKIKKDLSRRKFTSGGLADMNNSSSDTCSFSPDSKLRKLQKYLYHIAKADEVLKKMHPFDYRPASLHRKHSDLTSLSNSQDIFSRPTSSYFNNYPRLKDFYSISIPKCSDKDEYSKNIFLSQLNQNLLDKNFDYDPSLVDKYKDRLIRNSRLKQYYSEHLKSYKSLPNLTDEDFDQENLKFEYSPKNRFSKKLAYRDQCNLSYPNVNKLKILRRTLRSIDVKSNYDDAESTDALIDEATIHVQNVSRNFCNNTVFVDEPSRVRKRAQSSGSIDLSPISRMKTEPDSFFFFDSQVGVIGKSSINEKLYTRPYLPHLRSELFIGQAVKVLVPGKGVTMAKVADINPCIAHTNEVTVVLTSHSNRLLLPNTAITIPFDKILLAWPR